MSSGAKPGDRGGTGSRRGRLARRIQETDPAGGPAGTRRIIRLRPLPGPDIADIFRYVYTALQEKGYNPIDQIVGYLVTGDPTYITSHQEARTVIRRVDRLTPVEELVRTYAEAHLRR